MKIIEIGICIDNKDPKGFGRIRATSIDEQDSTRANAVPDYQQWSKDDPFVFSPFLPNHINIIPRIQQAIKIIRYDETKSLQNQEYVPGPYTTAHNFTYQNELSQLRETSYGQRAIKAPDIKSFTGNLKTYDDGFILPDSVGSLPKLDDVGFSGPYGSDIILSEHGVQLRAGKLIQREKAAALSDGNMEVYPIYSKKQSKISLKKFPSTLKLDSKVIENTVIPRTDIKHIFEYSVDSLVNPTQLTYSLYRVERNEGEKYKTDVFGLNSEINSGSTKVIYSQTYTLTQPDTQSKLQEAYIKVRDLISKIDRENLNKLDSTLEDIPAHPFYFRPTASLRNQTNSSSFLGKINYLTKTYGFGLIFSRTEPDIKPNLEKAEIPYLKKVSDVDQTFAAITADNILYLSTSTAGTDGKQIDFNALDKYEYTQEDYLMRIKPNTFSTVRGEKLIEILELMTLILLNHTHGITTPPFYFEEVIQELNKLISRAKQDLVNDSIRIN